LVTSVRGTALAPITAASAGLGVTGRMNAALGFLADFFLAFFVVFLAFVLFFAFFAI
jgi:hypothetical protein